MMKSIKDFISRYRHLLIALVYAAFVLLICYMLGNSTFSFGEDKVIAQRLHIIKSVCSRQENCSSEDLLPVNIAYDKQLVDWTDEYGLPVGKVPITDRSALLKFLQIAKQTGTYKYIMLDVFFEKGIETPVDSALFSLIAGMDKIVIPAHKDIPLADSVLLSKQGYADYGTSILDSDFGKYRYVHNELPSMSLKMYTEVTGSEFKQWGPFVFCNGRLSRKCIFPKFTINPGESFYTSEGDKVFYNLETDLLSYSEGIDYSTLLKDKYILIGDFTENDIHNTYVGDMSGAYINYNAFIDLMDGRQHVHAWELITLYIVYFLIAFFLLKHTSIFQYIPVLKKVSSPTWRIIFSWCGFSLLLTIVSAAMYIINGHIYDVLAVSTLFSLLSTGLEVYQTLKS